MNKGKQLEFLLSFHWLAPFCLPHVQTFLIQFALQPDSCLNQCFWQKDYFSIYWSSLNFFLWRTELDFLKKKGSDSYSNIFIQCSVTTDGTGENDLYVSTAIRLPDRNKWCYDWQCVLTTVERLHLHRLCILLWYQQVLSALQTQISDIKWDAASEGKFLFS